MRHSAPPGALPAGGPAPRGASPGGLPAHRDLLQGRRQEDCIRRQDSYQDVASLPAEPLHGPHLRYYIGYLLGYTWCVVPRGPGRASVGDVCYGMSRSRQFWTASSLMWPPGSSGPLLGFGKWGPISSLLPVYGSSPL